MCSLPNKFNLSKSLKVLPTFKAETLQAAILNFILITNISILLIYFKFLPIFRNVHLNTIIEGLEVLHATMDFKLFWCS